MQILCTVFRIDLGDFLFSVNVVLVHFVGISAAETAGGTVFTAASTAVQRSADDFFPFFLRRIFD